MMKSNNQTEPVRLGLVGAGQNASGHARAFLTQPRANLVAIADPVTARAEALAAETGARACADFQEFLDEVDAVIISSPSFLHLEQVAKIAEAGKAMLIEKPMATTLSDAIEVERIVRDAGLPSFIGFSMSSVPYARECFRALADGRIGKPRSLTAHRHLFLDPAKTAGWLLDGKLSGGMMLEMNIHEIEFLMRVGGEVKTVDARTALENPDYPRMSDHCYALLEFASGATGLHEGSWKSPLTSFYKSVIGDQGCLYTNQWGNEIYFERMGEDRQEIKAEHFDKQVHFLDIVQGKAKSEADVSWSLEVHFVVEAILESARKKCPINLTEFKTQSHHE
jgi:predicted dehydrogenase